MPERPVEPTLPHTLIDMLARLRAVERQTLSLPEGMDLQTFENGSPLGDTRFLNFGDGLHATLIGNDYVLVTGDAGGQSPFDAIVDSTFTASNPANREFLGIGEALSYLQATVGLTTCIIGVRSNSSGGTTYTETVNWTMPEMTHIVGLRGAATAITNGMFIWHWNGFRPSTTTASLRMERCGQWRPGTLASGGVTRPLDYVWLENCYVDFLSFPVLGTTFLCNNFFASYCIFDMIGAGSYQLATSRCVMVQCDLSMRPVLAAALTWQFGGTNSELIMMACGVCASDSTTILFPCNSYVDVTTMRGRGVTNPSAAITWTVLVGAGGGDGDITMRCDSHGTGLMRVTATVAFERLHLYGTFASLNITGAHGTSGSLLVAGELTGTNIITGPAQISVNLMTTTARLDLRGETIVGIVDSGNYTDSSGNLLTYTGATKTNLVVASDGSGASGTARPYAFDATSDDNVLLFTRVASWPNPGTDAGARNIVLPAAVGGGVGGHVIEDEGTPLTARANLNFVGAGVTVTDASPDTIVTIPGGGASAPEFLAVTKWSLL